MITEEQIKRELDGSFFTFDYYRGKTITTEVPVDYIPSHKSKFTMEDNGVRPRGHNWTETEDQTIFAMRRAGNTYKDIAKALGVSIEAVISRHRTLKPDDQKRTSKNRVYSPETVEQLIAMRSIGMPFPEIGARLGISRQKARDIWRHHTIRKKGALAA